MKGLLRILPVIAMVAVALPGMEKKGSFDITDVTAPSNIADFVRQAATLEDEGFFISLADPNKGKWPEIPVTTG
jgi:hypothetical protein